MGGDGANELAVNVWDILTSLGIVAPGKRHSGVVSRQVLYTRKAKCIIHRCALCKRDELQPLAASKRRCRGSNVEQLGFELATRFMCCRAIDSGWANEPPR